MTQELTVLTLAGLLQVVQYVLMAIPANMELGVRYTAGPRDRDRIDELSPATSRLLRALDNHFQGLILFTLAVVVVTLSDQATGFTTACAWLYFAARVAYVPAYVSGISGLRSGIWFVGFLSTTAMLIACLI